jgi:hypothetical protein
VRALLHPERLSLDVGDASAEDVLEAAGAALAEEQRARARDGDGRAAVGLRPVLGAVVERRVGALLYDTGLQG